PPNRRFGVVYRGGKLILRRKPITNGHGHEAVLGEGQAKFVITLSGTSAETAAVDAKHGRERTSPVLRPGEIQLKMLLIRVGIFDVRLEEYGIRDGQLGSVGCREK